MVEWLVSAAFAFVLPASKVPKSQRCLARLYRFIALNSVLTAARQVPGQQCSKALERKLITNVTRPTAALGDSAQTRRTILRQLYITSPAEQSSVIRKAILVHDVSFGTLETMDNVLEREKVGNPMWNACWSFRLVGVEVKSTNTDALKERLSAGAKPSGTSRDDAVLVDNVRS